MKAKKKAIKVLLVVLLACIVIYIANVIVCNSFFNPYKNGGYDAETVFTTATQLLCPMLTDSGLVQDQSDNPLPFSNYSQNFYIRKFSKLYKDYENENTGKLKYSFGKAEIKEYNDLLGLGTLTVQQKAFMQPGKEIPWNEITADSFYNVWLRFITPKTVEEVAAEYSHLFHDDFFSGGVIWLPIQTSDQPEDICMGAKGNLSWHYRHGNLLSDPAFNKVTAGNIHISFETSLSVLQNDVTVGKMFLNSGLYPGAENIDVKQRMGYVLKHGKQCLGMVAYLKGDLLQSLRNDDSIQMLSLQEDTL